jgi:hypothetical protein
MLIIALTENRANEYSPFPPTTRGRVCRRTRRAMNCTCSITTTSWLLENHSRIQFKHNLSRGTYNYSDCTATKGAAPRPHGQVVLVVIHEIALRGHHCYDLRIIEIVPSNLPVPPEKRSTQETFYNIHHSLHQEGMRNKYLKFIGILP